MERNRRGLLLVLSSPSGAGKTTLARRLLADDANLVMSVSATTRLPRPGEVDGKDYFFLDTSAFEQMIADGGFLEHAKVFDHYYGTPLAPVENALAQGRDVLFDIDWQGTQQLAQKLPLDLVRVFVLPPSREELHRRLQSRAQDSEAVVAKRMAKASAELSHWAEYDYVVVNREVDVAHGQISQILAAERLKRGRQLGLHAFVEGLMQAD